MDSQFSDESLLASLEASQRLFQQFKMTRTARCMQLIMDEVKRTEIIRSYLNLLFKNLQTTSQIEFSHNEYRNRIIRFLNRRINTVMMTNIERLVEANRAPEMLDMINDRVNAYKIVRTLSDILIKGSKSEYEKLLGLSYSYAASIEGVYKRSVQDCYVWERLAAETWRNDTASSLQEMDIHKIINYFDAHSIDKSIFDGYDDTVRNAIAHSTLYFDENTNTMKYKDKRAAMEVSYTFEQLRDKLQKIWDIYEMVLVKNQILRTNDACVMFMERKGSIRYP